MPTLFSSALSHDGKTVRRGRYRGLPAFAFALPGWQRSSRTIRNRLKKMARVWIALRIIVGWTIFKLKKEVE